MKEMITLKGKWTFKIDCKDGKKDIIVVNNLITTIGKQAVAKILSLEGENELFQYVAFGDGNTPPVIGNTILESEVGRLEPDSVIRAGNVIEVEIIAGYDVLNDYTIQEVGIFGVAATSNPDTGDLLSRVIVSPAIPKSMANRISAVYQLTIN